MYLVALCGVSVIPLAKLLSVIVVLVQVCIYNTLLDAKIAKHQLFYIFGLFDFGLFDFGLFAVIAVLLLHPQLGLTNVASWDGSCIAALNHLVPS
jgi:ATP:ADP antiporter, AAA family